jgi:LCP family protein required for cell wall assembly
MKLFGGFHGNRTKGTAKQPIPEETKEPVRKEPVPAQQAPAKAPEAAAPTAAAEETRRIETISDAGAKSPVQPEAAPAKTEEKRADTDAKPASDKRGKGLEKTRVFPAPETENEAGGAGEPGTGENPEKTIVFRTPEEEAEIEEIIAAYQKKKRRRRIIVLAILAVLVIGGVVLWKSLVKPPEIIQPTAKPTAQPTAKPTAKPTATPGPGEATPEPTPEETLPPERMRRENVYTFMMVGRDQVGGNTDTIMVGVFDVDAGEVNVVSIPRDTCANVDSNPRRTETKKISGIYARAGFDGLRDAVADMCGFPIDCYVSVGINGFIQLVNTIGGVTFYVPHNMNYDDPTQDLHIHFSAGEQYINGYDAIKVVRWRQNNDGTNYGDIDRINTQQSFLKTVFKQCLTLPNLVNNLDDYIAIFQEYVKTDLTTGNMTWFAKEFLKLQMDNIHFHTMPSNYNDMIGGFSYGTILVDEWLQMLNENLNPYDQPITLEDVDLIYRDEEGTLCATSGEIRGGMDSFLTMQEYLNMLHAWQDSQKKDEDSAASGGGEADSAPPAEQPAESGDTNGGE